MKTLIVDDEKPARDRLRSMLAQEAGVTLVGEASRVAEAVEAIGTHRPELLFLDIKMPGGSGFDVLRAIPTEIMPCTIFTTAYDTFAVEAFSVRALDYVLKPFTSERLREALARAKEQLGRRDIPDTKIPELLNALPRPRNGIERLLVKANERYLVVRTDEIDWVEAAANYVVLHTRGGNHVLRKAMLALEEELPVRQFFRASRSAIVNLAQIVEIQFVSAGEHLIILKSGARVPLTRGLRELQDRLQALQ